MALSEMSVAVTEDKQYVVVTFESGGGALQFNVLLTGGEADILVAGLLQASGMVPKAKMS